MSAGTIALTHNSTDVTGTGTSFLTDIKPNDFIVVTVGGTGYTLPVGSVTDDGALKLTRPYTGATASGVNWDRIPLAALMLITSQTVSDVASVARSFAYDKVNWQRLFTEDGEVTITLMDGTTFTGTSWKTITDLLNNIKPDELEAMANQIHTDAQQVAADKTTANTAATNAATSAAEAVTAKTDAQTANTAAQQAKTDAQAAKTAAEQAASSVPSDANIKALMKRLVRLGEVQWHHGTRSTIPTADGWIAADGQTLDSATFTDLWAMRANLPSATLALWTDSGDTAAPWKNRHCYVTATAATFRAPDLNGAVTLGGVQSLGHLFLAGAGGAGFDDSNPQTIGQAAPNIAGEIPSSPTFGLIYASSQPTGAFKVGTSRSYASGPSGQTATSYGIGFDASRSDSTYGRGGSWLYPHNVVGVWIIRAKYPF